MPERHPRIVTLCMDWEHPAWQGDFYPEDMPHEWRLTYFANEFNGVVLPQQRWLAMPDETLAAMREEVGEGFRFYLEISDPVALDVGREKAGWLGENLGGLVLAARVLQEQAPSPVPQEDLSLYPCVRFDIDASENAAPFPATAGLVVRIDNGGLATPLLQRRLLEQLLSRLASDTQVVLLCVEGGPPPLQLMRNLNLLAQLMGLA